MGLPFFCRSSGMFTVTVLLPKLGSGTKIAISRSKSIDSGT